MRLLTLSKSGINKVRSHLIDLKASDFEGSIKSIPPGEWFYYDINQNEVGIGYINPVIEDKFICSYVVGKLERSELHAFSVEDFLTKKISEAHRKRMIFTDYENGSRIFYGVSDGLPGLIVDMFVNAVVIQINTAGLDRYREVISVCISKLADKKTYFLDNTKYREKEFLPTFETENIPDLFVAENKLKYRIRSETLQKVGFYYDHRENRKQLITVLKSLNLKFEKGVDLFSYTGAWGMSALAADVRFLDFVDQGDFNTEVNEALKMNEFTGRGEFHRQDVFKFLDSKITLNEKYDLILCDPPAFAKSALQKNQALEGYSKLHRKVLKCLRSKAFCTFSSCTHYVDHDEFQKNIQDAARKEGRKLQLLYTGIQGWDHPIAVQSDKSNYIKSYFYFVE